MKFHEWYFKNGHFPSIVIKLAARQDINFNDEVADLDKDILGARLVYLHRYAEITDTGLNVSTTCWEASAKKDDALFRKALAVADVPEFEFIPFPEKVVHYPINDLLAEENEDRIFEYDEDGRPFKRMFLSEAKEMLSKDLNMLHDFADRLTYESES